MEELESLVSTPDDIFADEIELDNDPDYVPDPDDPQPSTSRSVPKAKSSATATATTSSASELPKPLPGGRSNAPIWAYYIADDKKVNGHLEKGAICQINVGGGICGKRILQNGSTTSGLNNHLFSKHPKQWELVKTAKANKEAERLSAKRNLSSLMECIAKMIWIEAFLQFFEAQLPSKLWLKFDYGQKYWIWKRTS